ncbi:4a-hydroxytetrahydrobiopterin dehydratase [Haloechinothrix salitolerans]
MSVMVELLADDQIAEAKAARPHWDVVGAAFVRTVELASFPQAIEAVNRVAEIAEDMNHHPDIDIRWRTLKFSVSTHSKGGITSNDVALIDRIDSVLAEL